MSDSSPREIKPFPKPIDVIGATEEALDLLAAVGVRPVLIGGVALGVYGIERYTKDVDFAVTVSDVAKTTPALQTRDPRPLKIGGISFSTSSGTRVDLIDRRVDFQALFQEAIQVSYQSGPLTKVGEREVLVVELAYLIALKMVADRPIDELDLQRLIAQPSLQFKKTRSIILQHLGIFAARRLDKIARGIQHPDAPPDYEEGES
jgi:hypothetical protein